MDCVGHVLQSLLGFGGLIGLWHSSSGIVRGSVSLESVLVIAWVQAKGLMMYLLPRWYKLFHSNRR